MLFGDMIYLILCLCLVRVRAEDYFNITTVDLVWSPPDCGDVSLVILIHSHPEHSTLRNTLRQTWAKQVSEGHFKTRTVFLIGEVEQEDLSRRLEEEMVSTSRFEKPLPQTERHSPRPSTGSPVPIP